MTNLVVRSNVANIYAEPATRSELISQSICGEFVEEDESQADFTHITTSDRYAGWVGKHHLAAVWDASDYLSTRTATLFTDVHESAPRNGVEPSDLVTKLPCGSAVVLAHASSIGDYVPILLPDRIPGFVHRLCLDATQDIQDLSTELADPAVRKSLDIDALKRRVIASVGLRAVDIGRRFIGTPYLWGGTTPFGIDCSGFVQLCYRLSGVRLLRDADPQFHDQRFMRVDEGAALDEAPLLCGDLVAFASERGGRITHIGLADGAGRFLHSSGGRGVYFDWCAADRYSATFAGAIRLSPDAELAIDGA